MTDTTNRVLSIDEVMALPNEQEVYTEEREGSRYYSAHTDGYGVKESISRSESDRTSYGTEWRVWSLPKPPTPEEIEANPWRKEGEASE